ncbi:MAG: AraC family transcriptional regulator, partial [Pseudomonadota bacterium]
MNTAELATAVDRFVKQTGRTGAEIQTGVANLMVLRHDRPTALESTLYRPVVCLILQGSKETSVGDRTIRLEAGQSVIVSHDLPVVSRVIEARRDQAYLAIILTLDLGIVRGLYEQVGSEALEEGPGRAMEVHDTDPALIDALGRYFALIGQGIEIEVMGPLILREIHFRLLMAPHGGTLRRLLRVDSHASRIARAIARIRTDFRTPLTVADLASVAGMSASSFHDHFKTITETTPLQYQKELRLLEARRLLSEGAHSVSAAAFEVGYESPTQFSREYARKFGVSPRQDVGAV